ncbi:disease resistance-like protein DSC1 [Hibiscus syriacus]|uniref:disease resistance-like protein DSC1 n=1 Tax=Hibiscus syriacus TaxID=106335 RepID=UPI0019223516|nr:disease resistance-like protein DSC1 [Hibiscus syriacus]
MEQLWNEDFQDLVNLREINVSFCVKLRKIPNLLGAINLEILDCKCCTSLVELPELPKMLNHLDLSLTKIEVPDSIEHLDRLETLYLRRFPIVKFPKIPRKVYLLDLSETQILEVSFSSEPSNNLQQLKMTNSKSLKLLSELPSNLKYLDTHGCISLESVSFADRNFYSFDDERDYTMIFSNCFSLNQDSVDNIETNAMLQIQFLAEKWASRYDHEFSINPEPNLFYCFPGNKISADRFEYHSMNSSLSLKIATRGSSGRRLLVFAICLVVDLTDCDSFGNLKFICEYQPLVANGNDGDGGFKKFKSKLFFREIDWKIYESKGDHVFILCGKDMVKEDQNYVEASFQFYIKHLSFIKNKEKHIKVKKCGVHVIYVDAESYTITDVMRYDKSNLNFDSQGDANTMEPHHHSATETSTRRSKRHRVTGH